MRECLPGSFPVGVLFWSSSGSPEDLTFRVYGGVTLFGWTTFRPSDSRFERLFRRKVWTSLSQDRETRSRSLFYRSQRVSLPFRLSDAITNGVCRVFLLNRSSVHTRKEQSYLTLNFRFLHKSRDLRSPSACLGVPVPEVPGNGPLPCRGGEGRHGVS